MIKNEEKKWFFYWKLRMQNDGVERVEGIEWEYVKSMLKRQDFFKKNVKHKIE